jgi:glycosyltransferase involved in cell wall biosynthesis
MLDIGLDLGYMKNDSRFWNFALKMISELILLNPEHHYTLYSVEPVDMQATNFTWIQTKNNRNIGNDYSFSRELKKRQLNLVIFFDSERKIFYKKRHFCFLESLQEISYPSKAKKSFIDKHFFRHFLNKYISNSEKVLCFDARTKEELNESFDKKEEEIAMIPGFFAKAPLNLSQAEKNMSVWNITANDYIIYEWGCGTNKNLEKLIKAMSLIHKEWSKIVLYVIWDELLRDIQLREYIVENDAAELVNVLWELDDHKKEYYYKHAMWVVLPSLYESFPFTVTNAIFYEKKIIASNIPSLKKIFWDNVEYFNPLSINQISDKLLWMKKQKKPNYELVIKAFTPKMSAKRMLYEIEN